MPAFNIAVFAAAPLIMQVHGVAASISALSGSAVMVMKKGTPQHMWLGRGFVFAMLATAITSFWITKSGHFSWIHVLSVITLVNLPIAIWQRRRGNILGHAIGMIANYIGLIIAGVFAFVPPRLMGQLFFGG